MKIVYLGTPTISVPPLKLLVKKGHEITCIITQPDRPRGRGTKNEPSSLKEVAISLGLSVFQPEKVKDHILINQIKNLSPDIGVVVAYGQFLPTSFLKVPKYGCINLHFSLLPKYRGASPVQTAILNGDEKSGISIIRLVKKMDAGPIILQKEENIEPRDTTGEVLDRFSNIGSELIVEAVSQIAKGESVELEQNESNASYCYQIKKEDGWINWDRDARYISRFIRAMTPWPGANTYLYLGAKRGQKLQITIKTATSSENKTGESGVVLGVSDQGIDVGTGQGVITILEMQRAGKNSLAVPEFIRGTPIRVGDRFEKSIQNHSSQTPGTADSAG